MLSAQGSHAEAARSLSQLILEQGERLTPSLLFADVSVPVRLRIHTVLMSDPELLEAYRRISTPKARRLFDESEFVKASRDYWLTLPGCESSLNSAQMLIESGRFWSGLRVLDRLSGHPDISAFGGRGLEIARTAHRAQPSDESLRILEWWSEQSGLPISSTEPFGQPKNISHESTSLIWRPIDPDAPALRLDGIVPRPIATAKLTPPASSDELTGIDDQPEATRTGAVSRPKPWSMPVVSGDTLITNDGVTISCFDRFTMRPRWRVTTTTLNTEEQDRTSMNVRARIARTIEDMSSATIAGDTVYVAAGLARTGGRTGDDRLLALDINTGALINSARLQDLDPSLSESTIRGSVIIDGDTLIIAARKNLRRQRLVALSLVGIDRHTFEHRWTREIGSAGSLPFQQIGQISHSGVLDNGVIYWTDMMGLMCGVETATGEILWARSMPTTDIYARYERDPWTTSTPIVHDDHIYILGVNGQQIDQLDKITGERLATTRAMTSGQGLYLIETPDHLASVNQTTITLHSLDQFGVIKPKMITPTGDGRSIIHGRVVSSGSTLIAPVSSGLAVLDSLHIGQRDLIELDQSGIVVALDGQILITDENQVSSYLSWDIARQLLTGRIEEHSDIHAAITLADLAYRSNHHDQILPAIDRAILMLRGSVIDSRGLSGARDRLFTVILDMVGLPDDQFNQAQLASVSLDSEIRKSLLQRTMSVARSPQQSLSHQMTLGAWHHALGEIPQAVRLYHGILQDKALASGMWQGGGLAIRAEIEATHQLSDIVSEYGRDACVIFDELAAADLLAMGQNESPQEYEQLARNYPWALTTPGVWAMAANQWFEDNNAPAAVRAAQSGLDSIKRLNVHGFNVDPQTIDSIGSALVGGLLESQRQSEASRAAAMLASSYPGITIKINGQPIDAGTLSTGLSSGQPAPVLGSRFVETDQPTLIAGTPVKSPIRTEFDTMVLFAPQLAQARMMSFTQSPPEVLWTRRGPDVAPPIAVVHNDFQTVLLWAPVGDDPQTGSIESIETISGKTRWKIDNLTTHIFEHSIREPDEAIQIDGQFVSPTEGVVQPNQILNACDGSVLVLVDRIGRGMGVDILTGQILWNGDLPINRVHDLDLSSGVLGVVGLWYVDHNPDTGEVLTRTPRIASVDARTGQTIQLLHAQTSTPRWIRVAPSGSLLVGTSQRVLSVSTRTGTLDWVIRIESLFNTNAGWIIDDTLVVLDEFVNLWPIGLGDGHTPLHSLDTMNRIFERGWVDVRAHGDQIAVTASGGMGIFDHSGTIIGLDPELTNLVYVDRAWASDRVVLVQRASSNDDKTMHIPVKLLDQHNAQLLDSINLELPSVIQRQPVNAQAANGVVIVGFGEVSVVLETE